MSPELRLGQSAVVKFAEGAPSVDTDHGPLGLKWRMDPDSKIREILLDFTNTPALVGKKDVTKRLVQFNKKGVGTTTLPGATPLVIDMERRLAPLTDWRAMHQARKEQNRDWGC